MKASTGNVADAVDEATGLRGFMARDMKPVFKAKVIGPRQEEMAVTILEEDNVFRGYWSGPTTPGE